MKKQIIALLFVMAPFISFAQLKVKNNGNVIIGTDTSSTAILVVGDMNTSANIYTSGIMVKKNHLVGQKTLGVGAMAKVANPINSGRTFGVIGGAGNATNGYNFGVYGVITGSKNGAGIYGTTYGIHSAIPGKYAGYFDDDTYVDGTLTANSMVTPSDSRLKTNIEPLTGRGTALDNVLNMHPIAYNYKKREIPKEELDTMQASTLKIFEAKNNKQSAIRHYGLIAQDLQELYPDLVYEGQEGYLGINYVELVPVLICAIQELKQELNELKGNETVHKAPQATEVSSIVAKGNVLYQNSPNPFNGQTLIRFQLAENVNNAAICIFDMQGKMLKNFPISSGNDSITVNSYELGQGMFLYSLIVNGQEIDTKKMIITK